MALHLEGVGGQGAQVGLRGIRHRQGHGQEAALAHLRRRGVPAGDDGDRGRVAAGGLPEALFETLGQLKQASGQSNPFVLLNRIREAPKQSGNRLESLIALTW